MVAAVAGGLTLAISPLLPGSAAADRSVLRDQVIPPLDLSAYPSPLVGYRKFTQDANQLWDQELFKVSGLPANTPVRIATLDDYNGSVWGATNSGATGGFLRVGPVIAPDAADATAVPGPVSTVRITIAPAYAAASDINAWLPTAGSVSGIGFSGTDASDAAASLRYNTSSSSGVVINRLTAGITVTLQTDLAAPTMPAAAQPFGPPDLTDGYSAEFSARAATWAKGAAGIGPQLQAIASYLRTQGAYSDGGPGESQYLPGHSAFRLTGFLNGQQPVGDDEQYAAAYALMASSLGMPARVVLGAIPEGDGTVRGKDVHAWVEIHVVGGAWVRIPDSAFMPDTTKKPDQQPPQQLQDAAATPVPPPNAAHPPTSDLEPHATGFSTNPPPSPPPGNSLAWLISLLIDAAWILSPFLLAGVVLATASGLKARRRHRRRTGGTAAARYAAGWRELVDYARDLGVTVPDRVTRRTQSQALVAFDLADLAWTADLVVYGPLEPSPDQAAAYWKRVDAARKAMGRASRRRRRVLAPLSLRSVRRHGRPCHGRPCHGRPCHGRRKRPMKLKLTLERPGAEPVDLLATVDADAQIGELADYLQRSDPAAPPPRPDATLRLAGAARGAIDPATKVGQSALRSGAVVTVTSAAGTAVQQLPESGVTLTVTSGADAPHRKTLRLGDNIVGRGSDCDVRLSDRQVSRRHARITIGTSVEIHDLASANGLQIDGRDVTRAVLRSGDVVRIGNTEVTITVAQAPAFAAQASSGAAFIRPPRLDPRFPGERLYAPNPPAPRERTMPPLIPILSPLLFGGVMYFASGRSSNAIVFAALSPLMSIGYTLESMVSGGRRTKRDAARYRDELADYTRQADEAFQREQDIRRREHPSVAQCRDAVLRTTDLLWARRPGEPGFGEFQLGIGRRASRTEHVIVPGPRGPQRAELEKLVASYAQVEDVPVVADPANDGAIGLAGPAESVLDAARALVFRAAALHSPAELCVAAIAPAEEWDWLKWLPHVSSAHSPLTGPRLAATGPDAVALVSELESVLAARLADKVTRLPAILLLVEGESAGERSRLVDLAERGGPHGIYVLWLAADRALLPAACRVVVDCAGGPGGGAAAAFLGTGEIVNPLATEGLARADAAELARALAPLVDAGAKVEDDSDLPASVPLLGVYDELLVPGAEAVVNRWRSSHSIVTGPLAPDRPARRSGGLRAFLGRTATGEHALDLRADGPHALVGGTTGSGKSELLQSWILALAAAYSPQRVTFLLVDYKGGSAFADCVACRTPSGWSPTSTSTSSAAR